MVSPGTGKSKQATLTMARNTVAKHLGLLLPESLHRIISGIFVYMAQVDRNDRRYFR